MCDDPTLLGSSKDSRAFGVEESHTWEMLPSGEDLSLRVGAKLHFLHTGTLIISAKSDT